MDKNSPKIGFVSLGCPKALVDSEVLVNKLQKLGYGISPNYTNADAVVVNTCGFLDSAKAESLNACLLYTSPSPRDATLSRMPSSA